MDAPERNVANDPRPGTGLGQESADEKARVKSGRLQEKNVEDDLENGRPASNGELSDFVSIISAVPASARELVHCLLIVQHSKSTTFASLIHSD